MSIIITKMIDIRLFFSFADWNCHLADILTWSQTLLRVKTTANLQCFMSKAKCRNR